MFSRISKFHSSIFAFHCGSTGDLKIIINSQFTGNIQFACIFIVNTISRNCTGNIHGLSGTVNNQLCGCNICILIKGYGRSKSILKFPCTGTSSSSGDSKIFAIDINISSTKSIFDNNNCSGQSICHCSCQFGVTFHTVCINNKDLVIFASKVIRIINSHVLIICALFSINEEFVAVNFTNQNAVTSIIGNDDIFGTICFFIFDVYVGCAFDVFSGNAGKIFRFKCGSDSIAVCEINGGFSRRFCDDEICAFRDFGDGDIGQADIRFSIVVVSVGSLRKDVADFFAFSDSTADGHFSIFDGGSEAVFIHTDKILGNAVTHLGKIHTEGAVSEGIGFFSGIALECDRCVIEIAIGEGPAGTITPEVDVAVIERCTGNSQFALITVSCSFPGCAEEVTGIVAVGVAVVVGGISGIVTGIDHTGTFKRTVNNFHFIVLTGSQDLKTIFIICCFSIVECNTFKSNIAIPSMSNVFVTR